MYGLYRNLNDFFMQELTSLNCKNDTKAYIVSILSKYKSPSFDYSKESITLLYSKAMYEQDFLTFQNIGDWLFFCKTLYPEHLNSASEDYFHSLARLSYYSCYKLINKKWILYENLADEFIDLTESTRKIIQKI